MNLHAHAALSLNQRRRMVGCVVEWGWSLTKAGSTSTISDDSTAPSAQGTHSSPQRAEQPGWVLHLGRGLGTRRPSRTPVAPARALALAQPRPGDEDADQFDGEAVL
jgi:hypothetical protein